MKKNNYRKPIKPHKNSINYRKNKLYRYNYNKDYFGELTNIPNSIKHKSLLRILLILGKFGPLTSTRISKMFGSKYSYEILKKLHPVESDLMPLCDWNALDPKMKLQDRRDLYNQLNNLFRLRWIDSDKDSEASFNNFEVSLSEDKNTFILWYGSNHKIKFSLNSEDSATLTLFESENIFRNYKLYVKIKGHKKQLYIEVAYNPQFREREFVTVISNGNIVSYSLNLRGLMLLLQLVAYDELRKKKSNYKKQLEEILFNLEKSTEMYFLKSWSDFRKLHFDVIRALKEIADNLYKLVLEIDIIDSYLLYIVTILYLSKLKQYFYWQMHTPTTEYYEYRDMILKKLGDFHMLEFENIRKVIEGPARLYRSYK